MSLYLRKATEADAEILFCWRNDPDTRANSFNTELVSYAEHIAWFSATIHDPAHEIFILCRGETLIGQVRLAFEDETAMVSYSIDTAYREQGYGLAILRLVENLCVKRKKPCILCGYVKKKNIASQLIFEKLGYTREDAREMTFLIFKKRIINKG